MNQDFNQQQYNDKLAQVASLAVTYAKDGTGYHSMKDAFNELCEISHANKGIDQEATRAVSILWMTIPETSLTHRSRRLQVS